MKRHKIPLDLLVLVAALGLVVIQIGLDGWMRFQVIQRATSTTQFKLPAFDETSPTGYRLGRRVVVFPVSADNCHWVMMAQELANNKTSWRIRWVNYDNAPQGRPVYWSQLLIWWLILCGALTSAVAGIPLGAGVEWGAVWAMVPLQLGLAIGLPLLFRKSFGNLSAAVMALGFGATYSAANLFMVGGTDHHGIVAGALVTSVLALCTASLRLPDSKKCQEFEACRSSGTTPWLVFAGVAMAMAFWISTATAYPVFLGVAAASTLWVLLGKNEEISSAFAIDIRIFTRVAAGGSLAFYFLEFFPNHFSMRLEVNHPLYALSLFAFGEALVLLTQSRRVGGSFPFLTLGLWALGFLAPILAIVLAKQLVFLPGDPFLYALHEKHIKEFKPLLGWIASQHWIEQTITVSPALLAPLLGLLILSKGAINGSHRASLALALGAATPMLVLAVGQLRWYNTSVLLCVPLIVLLVHLHARESPLPISLSRFARLALLVLLLTFCFQLPLRTAVLVIQQKGNLVPPPDESELSMIYARDIAHRLRAMSGKMPATVLSGPTATTWLAYYGGLRGLGTLYWENIDGLKAASTMFAISTEEDFIQAAKARQVDFVVYFSMDMFVSEYDNLSKEIRKPEDMESAPFITQLASGTAPPWISAIPLPAPAEVKALWTTGYDLRKAP